MHSVKYGTRTIDFNIRRSNRKSLAIEVHPDNTVLLVAPEHATLPEIKKKVIKRGRWIVKQQYYFEQFLPHTPIQEYVSGETHYYLGKRYRLKVKEGKTNQVKLKGGELLVFTSDMDREKVKSLLASWYFFHAKIKFQFLLDKSLSRFKEEGITFKRMDMKRMKNRWGSCTKRGVVTLNPELVRASTKCIEYVVIHELCHLVIPNHGKEFYELLNHKMPGWQKWKELLEKTLK